MRKGVGYFFFGYAVFPAPFVKKIILILLDYPETFFKNILTIYV